MDINYYLAREQESLMRAASATDPSARFTHQKLARKYGRMLDASVFPHHRPPLAPEPETGGENKGASCGDR